MLNFYKHLPDDLRPRYHNPRYEHHGLILPFRMLIVGASGSMKTNWLMNLLHAMSGTFHHITLLTKNADEPLYLLLKQKCPLSQLTVCEGMECLPALEDLDPEQQHLVIFDDMVTVRDQRPISEYFIRARKVAKGVSVVYLSQSFYRTPKLIRENLSYLVLKRLASLGDLSRILTEYALGVSKERLRQLYEVATRRPEDGLLIDIPQARFRRNFEVLG